MSDSKSNSASASNNNQATLEGVEVHPLVLLSVTDHYNRVAKDTKKRVVGCLLGERKGNTLDITNSFAVPFDEEERAPGTWFLDYNYLEDLAYMFKRVNSRELICGWYSSGPKLKKNDIDIHKLFFEYNTEPVCCIINVTELTDDLPTQAYVGVDVVQSDGRHIKEFAHVPSSITASEAEQVGVEHLLREISDISLSTLTTEVQHKSVSLTGLTERLTTIRDYLHEVVAGSLPVNQDILKNLQLIFNLLPDLSKENTIKAFAVQKNDLMLNVYIASLLRSILALDQLLENRLQNKSNEQEKEAKNLKRIEEQMAETEKNIFDDLSEKNKENKENKENESSNGNGKSGSKTKK